MADLFGDDDANPPDDAPKKKCPATDRDRERQKKTKEQRLDQRGRPWRPYRPRYGERD